MSWSVRPPRGAVAEAFLELCRDTPETHNVIAFLQEHPQATIQDWCEAFLIEQHYRWRAGRPRPVGDYLAACPALASAEHLLRWLIIEEVGYRGQYGEALNVSAFLTEFPLLSPEARDVLRRLLAECKDTSAATYTCASQQGGDGLQGSVPPEGPRELKRDPPPIIPGYQIEASLGCGAFGVVYRALDLTLQRWIAIKTSYRHRTASEEAVEAFLAEARRLAPLDHPGIVPVYQAGRTQDGRYYIASKLIDGVDLKRRLAEGPVPLSQAAHIVASVAEALHYAHLRGLVHRDIKPANILLPTFGDPCVVDFGLALHENEQSQRRGEISGTPAYMAPEQVRGDSHFLDGRTDIWALGVVLYELLTGRRPFRGTTTAALLEEIELREPKPCRMINDAVPLQLEQICLKCLQKPVAQRYATASDLAESLRWAVEGLPVSAVPPAVPAWSAPKPELAQSLDRACDDNVQFTVYRPKSVQPERWYTCLAFAHLAERPAEALPNEPDPLEEVQRQAERILGQRAEDYADVRQDSGESVPREGELTFLPVVPGVEFNPPQRSFVWREAVHREEFRLRAIRALDGKQARGRMSVFLGSILVAEIPLAFRVQAVAPVDVPPELSEAVAAHRFRRIYPAFADDDHFVVKQFESYARALRDQYLTQCRTLRAQGILGEDLRELIRTADVFQLFWSSHAMNSHRVREEWEYALSLDRINWIRPVYWETPLPTDPARGLPPAALRPAEFQRLSLLRESLAEEEITATSAAPQIGRFPHAAAGKAAPSWRSKAPTSHRSAGWLGKTTGGASIDKAREPQRPTETPDPPRPLQADKEQPSFLDQVISATTNTAPMQPQQQQRAASLIAKLQRVRAPRLNMSAPLDASGSVHSIELPLIIVVLGDFSGRATHGPRPPEHLLRDVDRDSLEDLFQFWRPGERWEAAVRNEPVWAGLLYLVRHAETGPQLRIRAVDVRKDQFLLDLRGAGEPEAMRIFQELRAADPATNQPPSLLLADWAFSCNAADQELLLGLARLAQALCCPLAVGLNPTWFGAERWRDLLEIDKAIARFTQEHSQAWGLLRKEPACRFVAAAIPSIAGDATESCDDACRALNPSWIIGAITAEAFARRAWFYEITAIEGGGGAPQDDEAARNPVDRRQRSPREELSAEAEVLLNQYGLCYVRRLETSARGVDRILVRAPVLHLPDDQADRHSLSQMLAAARVMHYLTLLASVRQPTLDNAIDCQDELSQWLQQYVAQETDVPERFPRRPLSRAEIRIDVRGRCIKAVLVLPSQDGSAQPLVLSAPLPLA